MNLFLVVGEHQGTGKTFIFRGNGDVRVAREMLEGLRADWAIGWPTITDEEFAELARRRATLRIIEVEIGDEVVARSPVTYISGLA